MQTIILSPSTRNDLTIAKIETRYSIPEILSHALFFDKFLILKEAQPPAPIQIGPPHRPLIVTPETDELIARNLVYEFVCDPRWQLAESVLAARSSVIEGRGGNPSEDAFISQNVASQCKDKEWLLTFDFLEGLAIPNGEVSIVDVLQFKSDHSDEKMVFWSEVYKIVSDVRWLASDNPDYELRKRLHHNYDAYSASAEKTWKRRVVDSMKLSFVLDGKALATIGISATSNSMGLTPTILTVALGALGMVRFSLDLLPSPLKTTQGAMAMSYLSSIENL